MNKSLKTELNSLKTYLTNKISNINKSHRLRLSSYKKFIEPHLLTFLLFVLKRKKVKTLLSAFYYLPEYTSEVVSECRTSYLRIKLKFIPNLLTYIKDKKSLPDPKINELELIYKKVKTMINDVDFVESKRVKNKIIRRQADLKSIIEKTKAIPEDKKHIRDKLALSILSFTGFRSMNIRILKLGTTLFKHNNIWYYEFSSEQQKSRSSKNTITGAFPEVLQQLLNRYINIFGKCDGDFLFSKNNGDMLEASSFCNFIKRSSEKYFDFVLNPHVFRDILFSYLLNAGCSFIDAELVLWHSPSMTSSDRAYFYQSNGEALIKVYDRYLKELYYGHTRIITNTDKIFKFEIPIENLDLINKIHLLIKDSGLLDDDKAS